MLQNTYQPSKISFILIERFISAQLFFKKIFILSQIKFCTKLIYGYIFLLNILLLCLKDPTYPEGKIVIFSYFHIFSQFLNDIVKN